MNEEAWEWIATSATLIVAGFMGLRMGELRVHSFLPHYPSSILCTESIEYHSQQDSKQTLHNTGNLVSSNYVGQCAAGVRPELSGMTSASRHTWCKICEEGGTLSAAAAMGGFLRRSWLPCLALWYTMPNLSTVVLKFAGGCCECASVEPVAECFMLVVWQDPSQAAVCP